MDEEKQPRNKLVMQRIFEYLAYLVVVGLIVTGGMLLYWNTQSTNILQIRENPLPVRPVTNTTGLYELVTFDYCKSSNIKGTVNAQLVSPSAIIKLPWPIESQAKGCLKTEAPIALPPYIANDTTYYFMFTVTYKINPLKTTTITFHSQSFTLKK
jgi:hypothetical protein